MLTNSVQHYPLCKICFLHLPAGEGFEFPADGVDGSIGAIYTTDSVLRPANDAAWQPEPHKVFRYRRTWRGWNRSYNAKGVISYVADEDVRWCCVYPNVEGEYLEIESAEVGAGEVAVPAERNFVVVSGEVSTGDIVLEYQTWIEAHDAPVILTGSGIILMIRDPK